MNFEGRTEQLSFSAGLQYQSGTDCKGWKERINVEPSAPSLHNAVKYHFRMCHDLSLHLTLADKTSPIHSTLNYLFNFSLLELRLAEFKYLYYLLKCGLIGFSMEEKNVLFVTAQAFFRVRQALLSQHQQLPIYKMNPKLFDTGDQPFRHHTAKQSIKYCIKSIEFLSQQLESGLMTFKDAQDQLDKSFWEQLACQLGFTIHLLNRVLVLSTVVDAIDQ